MNRREMIKWSLLSGGAALLAARSARAEAVSHPTGGIFDPPSPRVMTPFVQELHRMSVKAPLAGGAADLALPQNGGVAPNGTVYPQITGADALTTYLNSSDLIVAPQQRVAEFPPQLFYVLNARQARHVFHPEPPYSDNRGSIIWGYDGVFPGPTFISRYGQPILVRIINDLYFEEESNPAATDQRIPGGFGDPRISTHLHNGHTASESDGNPTDIYPLESPYPVVFNTIRFRDHHYANFFAGLDPQTAPNGDPAETVCTLWYHDHSHDFTAENVYKGLVGFHLLFDEVDSGDENDQNPKALRLPSGEFDIPLLFQDKRFDENGQLFLPDVFAPAPDGQFQFSGVLGDRFTVNGQIQPKLTVKRRKYRFRLLNAGPSRFYEFFLTQNDQDQEFHQIANDESLLEKPVKVKSVLISVAERADVVIDFSSFNTGDEVYLVNRLKMDDSGFGPVAIFDDNDDSFVKYETLPAGEGDHILRFDVAGDAPDSPPLPAKLGTNPVLPSDVLGKTPAELATHPNHKVFKFDFTQAAGLWTINGRPFNTDDRLHTVKRRQPGGPDGEVWTIWQDSSWAHPVHIHLEEFQILWRKIKVSEDEQGNPVLGTGTRPPESERCKKDVLRLDPLEAVQIFIRFRDFLGKYPIHCHNVIHEDHAMMVRFDVVDGP